MPDLNDRITGKAGFLTYEDDETRDAIGGKDIPITYWSIRAMKAFQDTTSSENYDNDTNLIYPRQIEVATATEGMISGRFRLSVVPPTFIAAMYSGDILPKITFNLTSTRKFGSGYFNVSEFEMEVPQDDVVNFTCRIIGNGKFTPETSAYFVD